jgi:hypothetical protein
MRADESGNELIIRETPGCLWLLGGLFCLVGGVFVYGALGGFSNRDEFSFWTLALAFLMGTVGVFAGVWVIYRAPVTKLSLNRTDENVTLTRYGLFGKRADSYRFGEIKQFLLIEEKDDESNPIWLLGMDLTSGETVKISSLPSHSEDFKRRFVFEANQFIYKQIPSPHLALLDLEGEKAIDFRKIDD